MKSHEIEVLSDIDGEEICIMVLINYYEVSLPDRNADNQEDYEGYEEIDYTVISVTNVETQEKIEKQLLTKYEHDLIKQSIRNYYE